MRPVHVLLPLLLILAPGACTPTPSYDLPPPSNVHIDSYNMRHVVRWDPLDQTPVVYHVVCDLGHEIRALCVNISETQCDFTDKMEPTWRGIVKVRAELEGRRSAWATTPKFQASRDTRIGPVTSLFLVSHMGKLDVEFSPPFSPIPTMWKLQYRLYYWKENTEEEEREVDLGVRSHYRLDQLEARTKYCVRVMPYMVHKEGQTSDPICETTTTTEYTAAQTLVFILLGVFGFGLLAGAVFLFHKQCRVLVKHFLQPPFNFPHHVEEFLQNPPEHVIVDHCELHYIEDRCDEISLVGAESFQELAEASAEERPRQNTDKT